MELTGWLLAALLCLDVAGLVFLYHWIPRYLDRRIENFQSDLVNQHYAEAENMYRTMRGWRHDYHNHIQAMKSYVELGRSSELLDYLGELDHSLDRVEQVVKTGNLMVDAILNSKLTLMKGKGIDTDVAVHVPSGIRITDSELCVLIGNLLDNAIEACEQVREEESRFIKIYIDTLQDQLYISVMNGMEGTARKQGTFFLSTKPGKEWHGFGLQRVDRIMEKYSGFLDRQSEEGVFATEVLLPLV